MLNSESLAYLEHFMALEELEEAKQYLAQAEQQFNLVVNDDLLDLAIKKLNVAEKRLDLAIAHIKLIEKTPWAEC